MCDGALDGNVICEIGVSMAVERLLRAGFRVAVPIVDEGYDILAFDNRCYWRIQVKSTAGSSGKWARNRIRVTHGRKRGGRYSNVQCDALVAVNIKTHVVMCVPVEAIRGRRWLPWREAPHWSDMGVLRRLKPQRCSCSRTDQRSRNQNGRA